MVLVLEGLVDGLTKEILNIISTTRVQIEVVRHIIGFSFEEDQFEI